MTVTRAASPIPVEETLARINATGMRGELGQDQGEVTPHHTSAHFVTVKKLLNMGPIISP